MPDTGFAADVTFGTNTGMNSWALLSITPPNYSREAVNTSHHATAGGYETYIPGDLVEGDVLVMECQHDPNEQAPITAVAETITVTYPVPSGLSNGATEAFSGFVTGYSRGALVKNTLMQSTVTVKVAGAPTFNDAS